MFKIINLVGLEGISYEIVVSDDSQNNLTKEIVFNYKKINRHVVYLKNTGRGQFDNLNNLIRRSQGDWIVFIHDDDILESDYLEYTFFNKDFSSEIGMMWTAKKVISNKGKNILSLLKSSPAVTIKFETREYFINVIIKRKLSLFTQKIPNPMITGLAIQRKICLKVDYFVNNIPLIADGLFLWKSLLCSKKALFIQKSLVSYRTSKDSETSLKFSLGEQYFILWKKLYSYLYQFMIKMNFQPIEKKEFWYYFYKQIFDINGCLLWTAYRSKCSYISRIKRIMKILEEVWSNFPLLFIHIQSLLVVIIALLPRFILDFFYRLYYVWFAYKIE